MIQDFTFWVLLLVSVPCYWCLPVAYRNPFLAMSSAIYLYTVDPLSVTILFALSLLVYTTAPLKLGRYDMPLTVAVLIAVFSLLAWFKYVPEFTSIAHPDSDLVKSAIIPLGISYYTFKLVHYLIEYRRGMFSDHTFSTFASYMFLFPIFTAGPIERFEHFLDNQSQRINLEDFNAGITRILYGLIKKVVIVDYFIQEWLHFWIGTKYVLNNPGDASTISLWAVLTVSYLTLYLEFSAYSDTAIGACRLFGIKIMENFNWPVVATNISDFWRRWHMTLARWCQTYVYMPVMGLTRMPYVAALASFTAIGLWHAGTLTRLSWGLYHASAIIIYMLWSRLRRKRFRKKFKGPASSLSGLVITQLFIISSMAFLVGEGSNDVVYVGQLILKLFFVDTFAQ